MADKQATLTTDAEIGVKAGDRLTADLCKRLVAEECDKLDFALRSADGGAERAFRLWPRAGNPWFIIARTVLGVGLIVYLGLSHAIDWPRLLGLANAWQLTAWALLLLFLAVLASSWRLCILLSGQGLELPLAASLRLSLIGALFNNFLPGSNGGDIVRIYLAARPHAGLRMEITASLLIDRGVGLLGLLVVPPLIAAFGGRAIPGNAPRTSLIISVAALGFIASVAAIARSAHANSTIRRSVMRVMGWFRLRACAQQVMDVVQAYPWSTRILLRALMLSLCSQALVIGAIQLILLANGASSPSWGAALLTPFGMLANALPLTPGGLGVGEAAFDALFQFAGVAGGAEAILSWRVLTTSIDLSGAAILLAGRTEVSMTGWDAAPIAGMSTAPGPGLAGTTSGDRDDAGRN